MVVILVYLQQILKVNGIWVEETKDYLNPTERF